MELLVGVIGAQLGKAAVGAIAQFLTRPKRITERMTVAIQKKSQNGQLKEKIMQELNSLTLKLHLCLQLASRGNNILQPAVDMVISTIEEFERFSDSISKIESDEACLSKLQALSAQLDSTIPLLNLSINAFGLVEKQFMSISTIMQASHLIRNCPKGKPIFHIERARLYKHALGSAREIWQLAFPKCTVSIKKEDTEPFSYVLKIDEKQKKSLYYEEKEGKLSFSTSVIESLKWCTTEQMKIRQTTFSPALIFTVLSSDQKSALLTLKTSYGIEFYSKQSKSQPKDYESDDEQEEEETENEDEGDDEEEDDDEDEEDTNNNNNNNNKDKNSKKKGGEKEKTLDNIKKEKDRNTNLVLFEHVLQLCALEFTEKRNHWDLNDEKLLFAFRGDKRKSMNDKTPQRAKLVQSLEHISTPKKNLATQFSNMKINPK